MAVLTNARHERFAQELAKGKTATEAYELAGYRGDRTAASRLSTNVNVQQRVAELQQRCAAKVEVTVESLITEAAELQTKAAAAEQYSAANGALKLKAELSGHYVQRKEDVTPRRDRRQIITELAQFLERRGPGQDSGTVSRAGAGRADNETVPTVPGHGTA